MGGSNPDHDEKEAKMTIFRKVLECLQRWKLGHDGIRTNTAQEMADRHEQLKDQVAEVLEDMVEAQEIICNEVANEDVLKNDTTEDRKRFIKTVNSQVGEIRGERRRLKDEHSSRGRGCSREYGQ